MWVAGLTVQWLIFAFSGSLSFIVVAASLLDLRGSSRASFTTSVLVVLAITTILQASVGHRLPIFEGPSTPYLTMLAVLVQGLPTYGLRQQLATALLIAGIVIAAVGWFAGRLIAQLFTPYVVGSFLFLLGATLVLRLAPAALGHTNGTDVDPAALAALIAIATMSVVITSIGPTVLRGLVFLLAYVLGVTVYLFAGGSMSTSTSSAWFVAPVLDALAVPSGTLAVLVVVTMLIPLVNVYASIETVASATPSRPMVDVRSATVLYGASQIVAGIFGAMGTVPRSESAGIVAASKSASRAPLIAAAAIVLVIAFLGPVVNMLAAFPVPVATDVLMLAVAFVTMIAWRLYGGVRWNWSRASMTAGGAALCFLLPLATSSGSSPLLVFLENPVLPGTLLAIAVDLTLRVGSRRRANQRS